MNWLNPQALYFLLLIPPVILLYFMKLRRKELIITGSFLWKKVMQDARVDSFFQKLKVNILLIIQILIILFIVAALVRPYFQSLGTLSSETIIILDTSAGMKAQEGKTTRFRLAKDRIFTMLQEARSGSAFMLIGVSDKPVILSGFTTDREKLRNILNNTEPYDTPSDIKPAVMLAASLLKSHTDAEIFLIGDKLPKDKDFKIEDLPSFHFIPTGTGRNNAGITVFDISRSAASKKTELYVKAENFSPSPINTFLEISLEGRLIEARELKLEAGGSQGFVFTIPNSFSGIVQAELSVKDDLASDNIARAWIGSTRDVKVLMVTKGNPFLQKLLSIIPGVKPEQISATDLKQENLKKYDVVIWENCNVPQINTGNHLFLNCRFKNNSIMEKGVTEAPKVMSWENSHPLFRFIDISDLNIAQSSEVVLPDGAKPVVQGDKAPLMFTYEKKNFRGIYVLFDLYKSDWQLLPSFPIFMANVIEYFSRQSEVSGIENHRTGENLALNFVTPGQKVEIKTPTGTKNDTPASSGEIISLPLEYTGIYKVSTGDMERIYPANLLSAAESDITPDPPIANKQNKTQSGKTFPLIREIWRELAMAALLFLLLEWYIFNRRRV
ncbi:MAG: VWA domain-containing protein [Firmicutes bacterium]|nr:VWA domain-containing protein [Bacillota bacterium]